MADDTRMSPTQGWPPPREAEETTPDGLVPVAAATPDTGMSTGAKVGIAAGITGATGLAAFGLYKLGSHKGWWGVPPVIFDDDEAAPGGGGGGGGGSKPSANPPPKKRGRARGNPPNITGDPQGYNTDLWPGPGPARLALLSQGYKVSATDEPLAPEGRPHPQLRRMQEDWNKVIRGIDSGRVKLPQDVDEPGLLKHYRGLLVVDGIPGKNSLNALEILFSNYTKNAVFWTKLVAEARS